MGHLLKNLFGILVLLLSIEISAQDILNFSLEPSAPEEGDSVHLIVDIVFSNSQCNLLGTQLSVSPDSFYLKICHFEGLFPATCDISDTILIGADMSPGDYTIELIVKNTGSMVDLVCNVASSESDTAYHNFTVTEKSVGISDLNSVEILWNTLIYDFLYIKNNEHLKGIVMIYSTNAELLVEQTLFRKREKVDLSNLSNGAYLVKFVSESGQQKSTVVSLIK